MNEELAKLGLRKLDIRVYVFLAKRGPQAGSQLCHDMKIAKQQLYPCLKKMQVLGIVGATHRHPATFYATPFENVIDLAIKTKLDEAQLTHQHKNELLEKWKNITEADFEK